MAKRVVLTPIMVFSAAATTFAKGSKRPSRPHLPSRLVLSIDSAPDRDDATLRGLHQSYAICRQMPRCREEIRPQSGPSHAPLLDFPSFATEAAS